MSSGRIAEIEYSLRLSLQSLKEQETYAFALLNESRGGASILTILVGQDFLDLFLAFSASRRNWKKRNPPSTGEKYAIA